MPSRWSCTCHPNTSLPSLEARPARPAQQIPSIPPHLELPFAGRFAGTRRSPHVSFTLKPTSRLTFVTHPSLIKGFAAVLGLA